LKAKFKRKRVHTLGGNVSGSVTVVGQKQIICDDDEKVHKECPVLNDAWGEETFSWNAGAGVELCWVFRTGWWGRGHPVNRNAMCPKPIRA
jgi:hypothetical protein